MKKFYLVILILVATAATINAQYLQHTVRFKDKQGSVYSVNRPSAYLSAKSILRRAKQRIPIDITDLPLNASYIDSIRKVPGVTVINSSKWLNQVLIATTDPAALARINQFSFVLRTAPVSVVSRVAGQDTINKEFTETITPLLPSAPRNPGNQTLGTTDVINYGNMYNQIHIHEGEYLHNLGFRGEGITIAILDAGFSGYKTNTALDSVTMQHRVLGEYDFVMNETSVDEDNSHGLYCFSILAANKPGIIVGSAPRANYYLYRTENVAAENPVEEQYWAIAAEQADSLGADMISSSLGYASYDDPALSHDYAKRDGNTAVITRAADLAAQKGMIVMSAVGNSGDLTTDYKYVSCPADGDSVIAVGAVDSAGNIASFSSWGPNGAGKLKPNIVSVGKGTIIANLAGNPASGNGTSFASPNVTGLIACLWQAFGEFTNMEITDAVQKSADRYDNPDERFGHGIPNFRIAYQLLQAKRESKYTSVLKGGWLKAYPVPFNSSFTVLLKAPATGAANFQLVDVAGRILQTRAMQVQIDNFYYVYFSPLSAASGVYYLHYNDGKNKTTLKMVKIVK